MAGRKFPINEWRFDYNPKRERWETYRIPQDWPYELFGWLHRTFGYPDVMTWDYHGGWIYFYDEKLVTAFMLRWS